MSVSPWLRLWLPMGNMLLLIAILETVNLLRNEVKDIGIMLYQGLSQDVGLDFWTYPELCFILISVSISLIAAIGLLLIGTIIKGHKGCFLAWIITSFISCVGLTLFIIINTASHAYAFDQLHIWSVVYSLAIFIIANAYILFITIAGYQAMVRQEALHPIGKGVMFIWEYFSNETKVAATFFLVSEIVLDAEYMVSRQFIQFFGVRLPGHDGDSYPPIVIEEIVLRLIRILTNSIGLWLVQKEKRRIFRWWCAFTFLLILVSTAIFVILTVQWRGEDISMTLAYFLMFPGHLLYRFLTLYFCLKYTRADFSSFVL